MTNKFAQQLALTFVVLLGICFFAAVLVAQAQPTADKLVHREQMLKESIDRLTAQRESLRNEVIALRQQVGEMKQAVRTNEVITIKIILPPAIKSDIRVENE